MTDRDRPPISPELERRLREAIARELATRELAAPPAPAEGDDPSPEALHDALAGALPEGERVRVLDRAMSTARGQREVALLRAARGAAAEAWPEAGGGARPEARRRAAWWLRPGVAAAAAAVLATGLGGGAWWQMMHSSPNTPAGADPVRSADAPAGGVTLRAGEVESRAGAPVVVGWSAVPDVVRYDVEVMRADGTVVWSGTTRDTTIQIPASALPPAGAAHDWWVRARTLGGESRRSPLGRIRGR